MSDDERCPHTRATVDECGCGQCWRKRNPRLEDDHTDAWSAGYTAGAKDRSAELARDLYGLADLIREQHLGWEATYDNIRRAADHYRKEGTQ